MFEFNKKEANLIKGIAILLMFYHHLFGFKSWIDPNLTFFELTIGDTSLNYILASFSKICVGIYIFTTGYSLLNNKIKNWRQLTIKIFKFLIQYWSIFILFLVFGLLYNEPFSPFNRFIKQLFGIATATGFNWEYFDGIHPVFAWYVSFYITFLVLSPILKKICVFNFFIDNLILIILFYGGYQLFLFQQWITVGETSLSFINNFVTWGYIGMLGYTFCKYNIFQKWDFFLQHKLKENHIWILSFLSILMMIILHHHLGNYLVGHFSIFAIFTPIFIYSILIIFRTFKLISIKKGLTLLSKQSTYTWFLHGIFFTPNKVLQPMIYCLKYPLLILAFTLFICYMISTFLSRLINPLLAHLFNQHL